MKNYKIKIHKTLYIKAENYAEAYAQAKEWLENHYNKLVIFPIEQDPE